MAEKNAYIVPTAAEIASVRRQFVMQQIINGMTTNKEIAEKWNKDHPAYPIKPETVQGDRKTAMDELSIQTFATTRQVRDILAARLDTVLRQLQPLVETRNLGAIDRYLKVIAQQSLLYGANMPAKIAFTDMEGTKDVSLLTSEERMQKMAELLEQIELRSSNIIEAEHL